MGADADISCNTCFLCKNTAQVRQNPRKKLLFNFLGQKWFFCHTLCCKKGQTTDLTKILRIYIEHPTPFCGKSQIFQFSAQSKIYRFH